MIRIGIIGSGFGSYGLLPAFRSVPGCEVVALCGKKRAQLLEECAAIGFTNLYTDWRMMLENEELDAVALAVTPNAQVEIATVAIKKGLHVFAEKPLTATLRQAKNLVALAEKHRIVHGIDFLLPEIAAWKKVKELIDMKAYGALRHLSVQWDFLSYDIEHGIASWKTDIAEGGGALSFFFSHDLHAIERFAGAITDLRSLFTYADESVNGGETGVDLLLSFASGVTGTAHISCNSRERATHQLVFSCEQAVIVLENEGSVVDHFTVRVHANGRMETIAVREDKNLRGEGERVKIVRKLAKRFVDCCQKKKPMDPSFHDGLRVQELIAMARRNTLRAK